MTWYSENVGVFATAKPFKYEDISYPATTFRSSEVLESLTIYPMVVENVDTRYYIQGPMTRTFADGVWTESYEAIDKDLEVLREELVKYWFSSLDTLLSPTDKFITRSDEMEQWFSKWVINPLLQQWRDDVYLQYNLKMNVITEAVTFAGLILADQQTMNIPDQPVPYLAEES